MNVVTQSSNLTFEAALTAVDAAVRKGLEMDCKVNVTVVDQGGNRLAFGRAPGAFLHSISISEDKAYTAVSFGFPTSEWGGVLGDDQNLRDGLLQRPRLVMIGGGFPITINGHVVGGLGVSGASEEQDQICAQAGLKAIGVDEN